MRDREKLKQAQHRWYIEVVRKRRETWIKENGPCQKCGSRESLEVDHVDPATKESHNIWTWKDTRRNTELAKCQVLCRNCHQDKSTKELKQSMTGKPNKPCRILTPEKVLQIREMVARGLSNSVVARKFGIGRTTVSNVRTGQSYSEIL